MLTNLVRNSGSVSVGEFPVALPDNVLRQIIFESQTITPITRASLGEETPWILSINSRPSVYFPSLVLKIFVTLLSYHP